MKKRIALREGDITELEVDALVNAANRRLILGAGVAGAIREAGGPSIQQECDAIAPIAVGDAAVTGAGELRARFVIHAAAIDEPGSAASEAYLRSAFQRSLELAAERGCRSLAAPAIGTGVGGLSLQRCAEIMLAVARAHLAGETSLEEIHFLLRGEAAFRVFENVDDGAKIEEQMARLRSR